MLCVLSNLLYYEFVNLTGVTEYENTSLLVVADFLDLSQYYKIVLKS